MPRKELLSLVLNVLSTMAGKIQLTAASALLALAESADGSPGSGKVTEGEITVLLQGLQSPCAAVRDASLQVGLFTLAMEVGNRQWKF